MTPHAVRRRALRSVFAFTLIEVLISTSIGMLLIAMAWGAFYHADTISKHNAARTRLAQAAGDLHHALSDDLRHLCQQYAFMACAVDGSSGEETTDGIENGITLTFMRPYASLQELETDQKSIFMLGWVRWGWDANTGLLYRSVTNQTITLGMYGYSEDGAKINSASFGSQLSTQPRRQASVDSDGNGVIDTVFDYTNKITDNENVLHENEWMIHENTSGREPDPYEINISSFNPRDNSDHENLRARRRLFCPNITDLSISWARADGYSVEDVDAASLTTCDRDNTGYHGIDGIWPDGHDANLVEARPVLFRITVTLEDPDTQISDTFRFSIAVEQL